MAGSNTGFSADAFRDAIHFAMSMGSPNDTVDKATFVWRTKDGFASADNSGDPWDWSDVPVVDNSVENVTLDNVAVEFRSGLGDLTARAVGQFDNPGATLTLLDTDYAQVVGADEVILGGNTYVVDYVTQVALFDVDVYQVFCTARDES